MNDVDIVAAGREAVDRIVCYDALSTQWNGRRDSDIVSDLCDEVERLEALPERITKLAEKLREYQTETRRDAMKHNSERLLGYAAGIDACAAELLILLTNPQGDSK